MAYRIKTAPKGPGTKTCSYCQRSRNALSVFPTNLVNDRICQPCLFRDGPKDRQSASIFLIGA